MRILKTELIFYVYVYLDPRKPGDYNYGEFHFDYEPFYIGKGQNDRLYDHLNETEEFTRNLYKTRKIKKLEKLGLQPIIFKLIENLDEKTAYDNETKLIELIGRYNKNTGTLVNIKDGGQGGWGAKEDSPNWGKKYNTEWKENISKGLLNHKTTDKTKSKISNTLKAKEYGRKIFGFNIINNSIFKCKSIMEASKKLNIQHSNICMCCNGKIKTAGNYIWSYIELTLDEFLLLKSKINKRTAKIQILKLDKEDNILEEYRSIKRASIDNNLRWSDIDDACKGKKDSAGNFKWKYKNE